jgi:hypothetical protein
MKPVLFFLLALMAIAYFGNTRPERLAIPAEPWAGLAGK